MKNKPILFFVILSAIAAVTGCSSGYDSGSIGGNEDFRSGSQGLTMSFMPNTPPSKIFDDMTFNAILEVRNQGAYDIKGSAYIYLSGFDSNILTGISASGVPINDLEGKSLYNSEGGYDTISFTGQFRDLESKGVDYYDTPIMATACYRYETWAQPSVCIDPDPFSTTKEKKVCSASNVEGLKGSQGAPVAVTGVAVEPSPGKSRFKITVSNVGGGAVIRDGASFLSKCSPYSLSKLEYNDVDYVKLVSVRVGDKTITGTCKPLDNQHIRLNSGSGYAWCELDGISGSNYKTPMTIQLAYNYRSTVQKDIRVVQSP